MKTIVIGFADLNGKGAGTVLAGPEVPFREQTQLVAQIKSSGLFPEGILRVEHCSLTAVSTAVEVRAAAKASEEENKAQAKREAAARAAIAKSRHSGGRTPTQVPTRKHRK